MIYIIDMIVFCSLLLRFLTVNVPFFNWYYYVYPTIFFGFIGLRLILTVRPDGDVYIYSKRVLERDKEWLLIAGGSFVLMAIIIPFYYFFR